MAGTSLSQPTEVLKWGKKESTVIMCISLNSPLKPLFCFDAYEWSDKYFQIFTLPVTSCLHTFQKLRLRTNAMLDSAESS